MGKALIIGCGGVASVTIHKCCQNSDVFEEICIASRTKSKCDALKEKLSGGKTKITTAQVDADDVNQLMIASDILILPSLFEGLPIVAVEAQATGLPTLLSDNISKEAKLVSSTEFLPIDNANRWSNRIISIINNKNNQRKSDLVALDKNGYNIISVSHFIQKILLG